MKIISPTWMFWMPGARAAEGNTTRKEARIRRTPAAITGQDARPDRDEIIDMGMTSIQGKYPGEFIRLSSMDGYRNNLEERSFPGEVPGEKRDGGDF
jgi:hypothetical protein